MHLADDALSGSGCCALSGNSNGPFVVSDFTLDPRNAHGRAHINVTVAREIGEAAGCVRPESHAYVLDDLFHAHNRIAELERDNAQLTAEAEALLVLVGGKLGARAGIIRREAGFKGRQEFDRQRDFVNAEDAPVEPVTA